jgi:AraC-like DNA-binding protein
VAEHVTADLSEIGDVLLQEQLFIAYWLATLQIAVRNDIVLKMSGSDHFSRFSIVEADVDVLREHYARTLKPVEVSPIVLGSAISVEDVHFSTGEFDIWAGICSSGMKVSFCEPPDAYVIYLPISGAMEIDSGGKQFNSTVGTVVAVDLSSSKALSLHPGRSHIGIAFSKKAVTRQLSELLEGPVIRDLEFSIEIDMPSGLSKRLHCMGRLLWDNLSTGPEGIASARSTELFFRTILVTLLEGVPHRYSALLARPVSAAVPRHVRRAIDFMTDNISAQLAMADVAREVGVSVRSLQLGFQQFKNTTPLNYLRQLRLEGARRDLLSSQDRLSVSAVAQHWGFTHMGRFSILYREAFGETPTESRQSFRCDK